MLKDVSQVKRKTIQKHFVSVIVPKGNSILLLQRKPDDFLPNIFELPGGRVEEKESLENAAKRELAEETGFVLKNFKAYLGYYNFKGQSKGINRMFNFVVSVEEISEIKYSEHQAYVWIVKNDLPSYSIHDKTLEMIRLYFNYFLGLK